VPFDFKGETKQTYVVRRADLKVGELGFLSPANRPARQKIYSFSVVE